MQDDDIGPISGINSGDIVIPVSGAGSASANIDMVSTKLITCMSQILFRTDYRLWNYRLIYLPDKN